jgi:hypothetical protein
LFIVIATTKYKRLRMRLVYLEAKPKRAGKVRAGASAEIEWTQELQTEQVTK